MRLRIPSFILTCRLLTLGVLVALLTALTAHIDAVSGGIVPAGGGVDGVEAFGPWMSTGGRSTDGGRDPDMDCPDRPWMAGDPNVVDHDADRNCYFRRDWTCRTQFNADEPTGELCMWSDCEECLGCNHLDVLSSDHWSGCCSTDSQGNCVGGYCVWSDHKHGTPDLDYCQECSSWRWRVEGTPSRSTYQDQFGRLMNFDEYMERINTKRVGVSDAINGSLFLHGVALPERGGPAVREYVPHHHYEAPAANRVVLNAASAGQQVSSPQSVLQFEPPAVAGTVVAVPESLYPGGAVWYGTTGGPQRLPAGGAPGWATGPTPAVVLNNRLEWGDAMQTFGSGPQSGGSYVRDGLSAAGTDMVPGGHPSDLPYYYDVWGLIHGSGGSRAARYPPAIGGTRMVPTDPRTPFVNATQVPLPVSTREQQPFRYPVHNGTRRIPGTPSWIIGAGTTRLPPGVLYPTRSWLATPQAPSPTVPLDRTRVPGTQGPSNVRVIGSGGDYRQRHSPSIVVAWDYVDGAYYYEVEIRDQRTNTRVALERSYTSRLRIGYLEMSPCSGSGPPVEYDVRVRAYDFAGGDAWTLPPRVQWRNMPVMATHQMPERHDCP